LINGHGAVDDAAAVPLEADAAGEPAESEPPFPAAGAAAAACPAGSVSPELPAQQSAAAGPAGRWLPSPVVPVTSGRRLGSCEGRTQP